MITDIDECAVPELQTDFCRYGCINTPGSYRCAEPNEVVDPKTNSFLKRCQIGYEVDETGGCVGKWIHSCRIKLIPIKKFITKLIRHVTKIK